MKRILQLALVCAGLGIIVAGTSCSSAYDATPDIPGRDTMKNPLRGEFTATLDGVYFSANSKYVSDQTVGGVRTLTITGIMDSEKKDPQTNKTISLSISNYNGPGTYPIQLGTAGSYTYRDKGVATTYLAKVDSAAMITITQDQTDVQGTFNFDVAPGGMGTADNHSVYGGTFNIPK
jgi:hypothetical protein